MAAEATMTDHNRVVALDAEMQRLRAQMALQPQLLIPNLIRIAGLQQERNGFCGRMREMGPKLTPSLLQHEPH